MLSGALFTLRLSLGGLLLGGVLGVLLAVLMQRSGLLERALLPYVVASQTVPLIAIAPLVAGWGGKIAVFGQPWQPWASVMVIAAYLAFFPIAVGMLRGLTSPRAADVELFRALACGWWTTLMRLRLPASVPFLIPSVRLAAAAAVIGAIVAEISTGTRGGIGRLIIEYAQAATGDPSRMYTAILGAAVLGLVAAGAVGLLDLALRRYQASDPMTGENPAAPWSSPASTRRSTLRRPGRGARAVRDRAAPGIRRVRVADRAVRVREVDAAAGGRRPGAAQLRHGAGRRQVGPRQARLDQDYGIAFQQAGLLEWRTVAENVELPLHVHGVAKARAPGPGRRAARPGRPRRLRRSAAQPALRRDAAAGRDRPLAGHAAERCCSWTSRSARWTR